MRRTEARELFMQMLFQMDMQKNYSEEARDSFAGIFMQDSDQLDYFNGLHTAFYENLDKIDVMIEENSDNWKINRIAKVDLAVLRLAITEIFYIDEVPPSVAINEAVDLSKKFGTEDSGKYVNGILGKIMRKKNEH